MADDKIRLPSGMGGLVRYTDESSSKKTFRPHWVIAFIILVILVEIILQL